MSPLPSTQTVPAWFSVTQFFDVLGHLVHKVPITVVQAGTSTLAQLYNLDGSSTTNPLPKDVDLQSGKAGGADPDGNMQFGVAAGSYDLMAGSTYVGTIHLTSQDSDLAHKQGTETWNGAKTITDKTSGTNIALRPRAGYFAVDTVNGSDSNDGKQGTEFRTLAHAVAALPATGGLIDVVGADAMTTTAVVPTAANMILRGIGRTTATVTAPSGAAMFSLTGPYASGTDSAFILKDIKVLGNGAGSKIADLTGLTFSGIVRLDGVEVKNFGSVALTIGVSVAWTEIFGGTYFHNNAGHLKIGNNADFLIDHAIFDDPVGAPQIQCEGPNGIIRATTFMYAGGSGLPPDILIAPTAAGYGHIFIDEGVKFGTEGENASRVKIKVAASSNTIVTPGLKILGANFGGLPGQTAMQFDTHLFGALIDNNLFEDFTTLVNDNQSGVPATSAGMCRWGRGNQYMRSNRSSTDSAVSIFANGGRNFSTVENDGSLAEYEI